jgi:hypothetical protein
MAKDKPKSVLHSDLCCLAQRAPHAIRYVDRFNVAGGAFRSLPNAAVTAAFATSEIVITGPQAGPPAAIDLNT